MGYPGVTYSFTNGTDADASQVNQNFSDLIAGFSDGSKDANMNDAAFGGTLGVTGVTSLTGNLAINTDKFTVAAATGNTVVGGTLGVTGAVTLSSTLTDGTATLSAGVWTGLTALTSTAITGTLQTAAQANVTSLGTLTGLTVGGILSVGTEAPSIGWLETDIDYALYTVDTTIDTANSYFANVNQMIKTAGATTADDFLIGDYYESTFNQSGGTINSLYGKYGLTTVTDGTVTGVCAGYQNSVQVAAGTATVTGSVYGIRNIVSTSGTVSTNLYGIYSTLTSGSTGVDNAYGLYVGIDMNTAATTSYGIYLTEDTNVDYGIYQNGTAANVFGGNVGIGVTPTDKFEIADVADHTIMDVSCYSDTGTHAARIFLRKSNVDTLSTLTATEDGQSLGDIFFQGVDSGSGWDTAAGIRCYQDGATDSDLGGRLVLQTQPRGGALTDRVVIGSSGNVGITTGDLKVSTDSKKLYLGASDDAYVEFDGNSLNLVANAVTAGDDMNFTADLFLFNSVADNAAILRVYGANATTEYAGIGIETGYAIFSGGGVETTSTGLKLVAANAGIEFDAVTIDSSGNVGIGLTPTANMAGLSIEAGLLTLKERTTPTADTNYGKIYCKSDNKLYFQDGAGAEHEIAFTA